MHVIWRVEIFVVLTAAFLAQGHQVNPGRTELVNLVPIMFAIIALGLL